VTLRGAAPAGFAGATPERGLAQLPFDGASTVNDSPSTKHGHGERDADLPSERSFGRVFAVVFALGGLYVLYKSKPVALAVLMFALAAAVFAIGYRRPHWLSRPNKAWFQLGLLMGRIVNPIVLGAIFYAVITPVAVAGRLIGRDPLRLRRQKAESYWITRDQPGAVGDSFKNQF
jgi:uncharacterized membrane protein YphA (DoxX/SURF4 family)